MWPPVPVAMLEDESALEVAPPAPATVSASSPEQAAASAMLRAADAPCVEILMSLVFDNGLDAHDAILNAIDPPQVAGFVEGNAAQRTCGEHQRQPIEQLALERVGVERRCADIADEDDLAGLAADQDVANRQARRKGHQVVHLAVHHRLHGVAVDAVHRAAVVVRTDGA